jgi:spore maturation protein CgeB
MVKDGAEMARVLRDVKDDAELRDRLVRNGLETIRTRHTCAHRAEELLTIVEQLRAPALRSVA